MKGFLYDTAKQLYSEHGDGISELKIVLPGKRARLFFSKALSELTERPLWQPTYLSVDEVMRKLSGLVEADRIRLVTELYKVYSLWHSEDFDTFYRWGEVLLADFDTVDKYMIDPKAIFSNIDDLKKIDEQFLGLSPEQIGMIEKFWGTFTLGTLSKEQVHFKTIWESLLPIYMEFTRRLKEMGVGYGGMIYRDATEHLGECEGEYVFVGFNALNKCEQTLFRHLKRSGQARFFWDYDDYYYRDKRHEAGTFIRRNISAYGNDMRVDNDNFITEKEVTVVSSPSDALQSRYVSTYLDGISNPDSETAIVLTDENLLVPVLHSIPTSVADVNITMGYPLRGTPAYTLVERLIELQRRCPDGRFYHADVKGILNHPYIHTPETTVLQKKLTESGVIYVSTDQLTDYGDIFHRTADWMQFSSYLVSLITTLVGKEAMEHSDREFLTLISEEAIKLENTLRGCDIALSDRIYFSLLRKVLQSVRVAYEGEPIRGVQVMGILETRNLDFENVVILSMNDDTYPGKRLSPSFIPYNLRLAYGLPTPQHHEAMYSYYFYRMLQRASNVHIVYSSKSDELSNGEPSRYIYQLDYESPHNVERKNISLSIGLAEDRTITVAKMPKMLEQIAQSRLSPSSYYKFIECPLKFYYYVVEKLRVPDEVAEDMDDAIFGSVLHGAMERLYKPFGRMELSAEDFAALIKSEKIEISVDEAINELYLRDDNPGGSEYAGRLQIVRDIIVRYIRDGIVPFDAASAAGERFGIHGLESWVGCEYNVSIPSGVVSLNLGGRTDRIDTLADGRLRIVDYKTGGNKTNIKSLDDLFSEEPAKRNSAAFQTFLYSLIVDRSTGRGTAAALYVVRNMGSADFSPYFRVDGESVVLFDNVKQRFTELFDDSIRKLFDPSEPFYQTPEVKTCEYCDYRKICKR